MKQYLVLDHVPDHPAQGWKQGHGPKAVQERCWRDVASHTAQQAQGCATAAESFCTPPAHRYTPGHLISIQVHHGVGNLNLVCCHIGVCCCCVCKVSGSDTLVVRHKCSRLDASAGAKGVCLAAWPEQITIGSKRLVGCPQTLHHLELTGSEVVQDARALLVLDHRRDGHRSGAKSSRTHTRGSRESSQMHADQAELPLVAKEGDKRDCSGRKLHDLKNPSGAAGVFLLLA